MATDAPPVLSGHRGFQLHVDPDQHGNLGLRLIETNGHPAHQRHVGSLPARRYAKVSDVVVDAVREAGRQPVVLNPTRRKPIDLTESAGVRLALALNAIHGISKPGRTRTLLDALGRLSDEECLYWYAACLSGRSTDARRLRALRLFLADD